MTQVYGEGLKTILETGSGLVHLAEAKLDMW